VWEQQFLDELCAYTGFGPEHAESLRAIAPHVQPSFDAIVDSFYDSIFRTPRAASVFTTPRTTCCACATTSGWRRWGRSPASSVTSCADPRVDLHATRGQGGVQIGVTDNGAGIPTELAGSAFTPFVTSKPSGTGLGLAIVQKIARQHGGVAELIPLARGTTARLEIPD
jgi:Histidine kinase-, DNA gyrase B-, and HSP90-like ATPase/Protoglobin